MQRLLLLLHQAWLQLQLRQFRPQVVLIDSLRFLAEQAFRLLFQALGRSVDLQR